MLEWFECFLDFTRPNTLLTICIFCTKALLFAPKRSPCSPTKNYLSLLLSWKNRTLKNCLSAKNRCSSNLYSYSYNKLSTNYIWVVSSRPPRWLSNVQIDFSEMLGNCCLIDAEDSLFNLASRLFSMTLWPSTEFF